MSRHLIFHVIDKLSDAGSTTTGPSQLLYHLVSRGNQQRYAFQVWGLRRDDVARTALIEQGLPVRCLARHRYDPRVPGDLLRLVRRERPALLHVHGFAASNYGRWVGRKVGIPVLIHEHGINGSIPLYQRLADRLLSSFPAEAIAVSADVASYLTCHRQIPAERVHPIHNGVDVSSFAPAQPHQADELRRANAFGERRTVGIIGRFHSIKGQEDLLRAAVPVSQRLPDALFLFIGDGTNRPALERLSGTLGLDDNVRFLGHRGDVAELLKVTDVVVIASHMEAISLALLEAMATGQAVVATRVGGNLEVVQHETSGLLVPPANSGALAEAIVRLLEDAPLRARLGQAATRRIRESFTLEAMVSSVESLYERLINREDA